MVDNQVRKDEEGERRYPARLKKCIRKGEWQGWHFVLAIVERIPDDPHPDVILNGKLIASGLFPAERMATDVFASQFLLGGPEEYRSRRKRR